MTTQMEHIRTAKGVKMEMIRSWKITPTTGNTDHVIFTLLAYFYNKFILFTSSQQLFHLEVFEKILVEKLYFQDLCYKARQFMEKC